MVQCMTISPQQYSLVQNVCSAINSFSCQWCEIYIIHTYSIIAHTSHCDIGRCNCPSLTWTSYPIRFALCLSS